LLLRPAAGIAKQPDPLSIGFVSEHANAGIVKTCVLAVP
jgi:hypothetical protein